MTDPKTQTTKDKCSRCKRLTEHLNFSERYGEGLICRACSNHDYAHPDSFDRNYDTAEDYA